MLLLLNVTFLRGCFSRVLSCTNGAKLCKATKMNLRRILTEDQNFGVVIWHTKFFHHLLTFFIVLVQYSISITPENVRKQEVFMTFSGGLEMEQWIKMG